MIDLLMTTICNTIAMLSICITMNITMTMTMTTMITMTLTMFMMGRSVRVPKLSCHAHARA